MVCAFSCGAVRESIHVCNNVLGVAGGGPECRQDLGEGGETSERRPGRLTCASLHTLEPPVQTANGTRLGLDISFGAAVLWVFCLSVTATSSPCQQEPLPGARPRRTRRRRIRREQCWQRGPRRGQHRLCCLESGQLGKRAHTPMWVHVGKVGETLHLLGAKIPTLLTLKDTLQSDKVRSNGDGGHEQSEHDELGEDAPVRQQSTGRRIGVFGIKGPADNRTPLQMVRTAEYPAGPGWPSVLREACDEMAAVARVDKRNNNNNNVLLSTTPMEYHSDTAVPELSPSFDPLPGFDELEPTNDVRAKVVITSISSISSNMAEPRRIVLADPLARPGEVTRLAVAGQGAPGAPGDVKMYEWDGHVSHWLRLLLQIAGLGVLCIAVCMAYVLQAAG